MWLTSPQRGVQMPGMSSGLNGLVQILRQNGPAGKRLLAACGFELARYLGQMNIDKAGPGHCYFVISGRWRNLFVMSSGNFPAACSC